MRKILVFLKDLFPLPIIILAVLTAFLSLVPSLVFYKNLSNKLDRIDTEIYLQRQDILSMTQYMKAKEAGQAASASPSPSPKPVVKTLTPKPSVEGQ